MWNSCSSDSSPWKMLPPIRPYSCSISCGPTMSRCRIDDLKPVAVRVELLGVRCIGPVGGHPLGEERHDMRAIGIERLVESGGNDPVAERQQCRLASAGVLERRLDELDARCHLDRAGVVLGLTVA